MSMCSLQIRYISHEISL